MPLDLSRMTRGEVSILIGYKYGERARAEYGLDRLDQQNEAVDVILPPELKTITPSFVQGFFGKSALVLGRAEFFERYHFLNWPRALLDQIEAGIELALMERPLVQRPAHA